jgi:phosphoenolpyruvate-protein kinase (PTS system EI component)
MTAPKQTLAEFTPGKEIALRGVAAAPGAAVGTAARVAEAAFDLGEESAADPAVERERLTKALDAAEARLRATLEGLADKHRPAHAILSAHLTFLQDPWYATAPWGWWPLARRPAGRGTTR